MREGNLGKGGEMTGELKPVIYLLSSSTRDVPAQAHRHRAKK